MTEAVSAFPGWDLSEAIAKINTALGAGRAEVRLNYARGIADFTIKSFDSQVTGVLATAESEDEVNQISGLINAAFEDAVNQLDTDLTEIIEEASGVEGLESRIEETRAYADEIRASAGEKARYGKAKAELAVAGKRGEITLNNIQVAMKARFDGAKTHDEVDQVLEDTEFDVKTASRLVNNQLDDIMDNNNLYGTPSEKSTEKLRTAMGKDVEKLQGRAVQQAKKRKAALDREEANRARKYYNEVKATADKAAKNVSSYERVRLLYIDKVQSAANDTAREKAQANVKKYEAMILEQKEIQAAAQKEADRLKEASDNAEALANIAEEMATAKEETDAVIQGLVDSMEKVDLEILKRNGQIEKAYESID